MEPVEKLEQAKERFGVAKDDFIAIQIGESREL